MKNILTHILMKLSDRITPLNAISGYELMWVIDDEHEQLTDDKKKSLKDTFGDDILEKIFFSITGDDKISVFSPDMHVRINHLGEIFFCPPTHKYMPDEIAKAYKRLMKLRFPEISQEIDNLVIDFMRKSEYKLSESDSTLKNVHKAYLAESDEFKVQVHIFPSIIFVDDSLKKIREAEENNIIIVPQEQSPAPFVNFIREYPELVETESKVLIWVADINTKNISPFVGLPRDEAFWMNLANPKRSLQSARVWSQGVIRSQVLDGSI